MLSSKTQKRKPEVISVRKIKRLTQVSLVEDGTSFSRVFLKISLSRLSLFQFTLGKYFYLPLEVK